MIAAIASLLACQLLGEILVRALALPLPGPVAGFVLMFGVLFWRGRHDLGSDQEHRHVPEDLGRVADALLQNLSLLFIPASVGVVQYLALMRTMALPIATAIVVSTTLALIVTAVTFRFVSRLHAFRHRSLEEDIEVAADLAPPREEDRS